MKTADKKRVIERYTNRIKKVGANIRGLASGTEERRALRFEVLTQVGIQTNDTVLDLGCGFGDFYSFLNKKDIHTKYTGIDINPLLIKHAKKKHPGVPFKVMDIQKESPGEFDWIVSTSCFNLKLSSTSNYDFIEDILRRSYAISKKGVAIDMLTTYLDYKGNPEEAFYYQPERIFKIAKGITKCVCLRHDYKLFEFCIYLYADFRGWSKK